MKKALRWIIGIIAALLLVCITMLVFRNPLLRELLEYQVEKETGVEASIGAFQLDLAASSVRVQDFKLANPPGFGTSPLLRMPELFLQIDRAASTNGHLRFREARLNLAELNVIRNERGETNIFALHKKLSRKSQDKEEDKGLEFAGIGKLQVSLGAVRYQDMQNPTNNIAFDIGVKDETVTTIRNQEDLEQWAAAFLLRIVIQQAMKRQNGQGLLDLLRPPRSN